jgi:hypothetical protein
VLGLAREHQQLAWKTYTDNSERLLAPLSMMSSLIVAQYTPQVFWSGVPLAEIEAWARAHVPAEMTPVIGRGMESARLLLAQKTTLVREADAFLKK